VIERMCMTSDAPREAFYRAIANSFIMSVDCAHAINPNYADAHEPKHPIILNGGPVHKVNANERYTGQIEAVEHLKKCAKKAEVALQTFVARTDVGTGSTIGPMTATRLGIRSVDIGSPIISMHSSREMGGTVDQKSMVDLLREHFTL
jgi:aspartyl aminopeptidase